ncbi:acyl-CoA dehydrogenase family protein [Corynebacterium gerontici]|uniref:Acyl-CoA dehydrogenase n=1 Tax=Corynebacterium gerontici TaxID=2079234 RepID=A0A3G6J0H6_9CORY|nr:acyl-CoA dehydrogenase family protein [Corynebacterium gerontici]AZA11293.1 hypothetical protein CGERO_04885 [Corynebacterium gerontici]
MALPVDLAQLVAQRAKAVDKGELSANYLVQHLAERELLQVVNNHPDKLLTLVRLIRDVAELDLSAAFSLWAQSMAIEYLAQADTDYAREVLPVLLRGERPGVTGMASVFKQAAGCGDIELQATPVKGGYEVSGVLRWASNLVEDSLVVTGAVADGPLVFAIDASAPGVSLGKPFGLLGLNATASTSLEFDRAFVPERQVLATDLQGFARSVRPTFVLLQTSECLGLAHTAAQEATKRLEGVNGVFASEVQAINEHIASLVEHQEELSRGVEKQVDPVALIELRLAAAQAAASATQLEVRVAGGAGYAQHSPASRRFREAAFLPVQSPSEAQLRWELDRAREAA